MKGELVLRPMHYRGACAFIEKHHRHHRPPQGYKYAVAVSKEDKIVGVAVAGRPLSRYLDDGWTLEVTRVCSDGTKNVCSMLYAACRRIAKEMGYKQLVTYTLDTESGISLKAAGWTRAGKAGGKSWNVPGRPRNDLHLINPALGQLKIKYCITL